MTADRSHFWNLLGPVLAKEDLHTWGLRENDAGTGAERMMIDSEGLRPLRVGIRKEAAVLLDLKLASYETIQDCQL